MIMDQQTMSSRFTQDVFFLFDDDSHNEEERGCLGIFGRKCDQVGLATSFFCGGISEIPLFKFYSVGSSVNGSNVLPESYVDFDGDTYDSDILNVSKFVRRPRSCAHFSWHWRTEFPNKF